MHDLALTRKVAGYERVVRERRREGKRGEGGGGREGQGGRAGEREGGRERSGHCVWKREPRVRRRERALRVWVSCGCFCAAKVRGTCGRVTGK